MPPTSYLLSESDIADFLNQVGHTPDLCIIVPAFNEEQVISRSLQALAQVFQPEHIYVVSDGSQDRTAELAREYTLNVLELPSNRGKAKALAALIQAYDLTSRYQYILFSDADSQLSPTFVAEARTALADNPACIVGTVTSHRRGLFSAFRVYEHALNSLIFKRAQSLLGVIVIAPGCASAYRADALRELSLGDNLTEDFDLSLQLYKQNLGSVVFLPQALVTTQEPTNYRDFWRQIMRWHTGFWQNLYTHRVYRMRQRIDWEIAFLVLDSLSWIGFLILADRNLVITLYLAAGSMLLALCINLTVLLWQRQFWTLKYLPLFPILQLMNTSSYLLSLFRAIAIGTNKIPWHKPARYSV